jgi:DNA-binding LacI/PurR family transcriptional regulator
VKNRQNRVTLADVAAEAGVSRTAVAKVLLGTGGDHVRVAEDTAAKVKVAATRLNYHPNRAAQQLRGAQSRILGVLMHTMNAPVMQNRLAALENVAAAHGYRLLVAQTRHDTAALPEFVSDLQGYGIDGLLCLFDLTTGARKDIKPVFRGLKNVIFHGSPLFDGAYCVRVDTVQAVRKIMAHLLETGRKRIGMELWNLDDKLMQLREEGYRAALAEAGRAVDDDLIWIAQSDHPNPSENVVNQAIDFFIDQQKVDAIVASNDLWAVRFVQKLKARGLRVPEDVAVVGYDNLELATVIDPPLTTIDQRHKEYAETAIQLMIDLIADKSIPKSDRTRVIEPDLVVRGSSQ